MAWVRRITASGLRPSGVAYEDPAGVGRVVSHGGINRRTTFAGGESAHIDPKLVAPAVNHEGRVAVGHPEMVTGLGTAPAFAFAGYLVGGAFLSVEFDAWHDVGHDLRESRGFALGVTENLVVLPNRREKCHGLDEFP
jgi:hypothetical protein